ncbi:MAG: leucine-rich repeat protein [Chitinispirillales bacterium]|jgi:hypothetical protein|nr:leucine-rich repeat protein [Chitinispirillales bacterium]
MKAKAFTKLVGAAVAAVVCWAGAAGAQTWNIGVGEDSASVTATLSGGTLTISGTGEMADLLSPPWHDDRDSITSLIIEEGVTTIGDFAFYACSLLTSVTIPNSVTRIGSAAFVYTTGLTSITIPNSVTQIDNMAFFGTGLTSITIPNSVTIIGQYAFSNATSLISATIGSGVTLITSNTFSSCVNLRRVDFLRREPMTEIGPDMFWETQPSLRIYGFSENTSISEYAGITFIPYQTDISLDPSEAHSFDSAQFGYSARDTLTVTVAREFVLPPGAAGTLSIALSGANPTAFTLNRTVIPNSAPEEGEESITFTVMPVLGLGAGVYTAAVTVSAAEDNEKDWITPQSTGVTANITAKPITINDVTAVNRNADGTTTVALAGGTLTGVVTGDNVGFTLGSGTIATPEAGNNKPVTTNIALTGADANNYTLTQPTGITVNIATVAILVSDRTVPNAGSSEEAAVIAPINIFAGEFTAGPNPVSRNSGGVDIFRLGRRFEDGVLTVYDASGNAVNRVNISDRSTVDTQSRRIAGSWNLTDARGRPVSEGTYLLKGVIVTSDGNRENVSVIIGVR